MDAYEDLPATTPGAPVEVRSHFGLCWTRGFEVVEAVHDPDGYRIRRASDRSILPAVFPPDDVRADRADPHEGWWTGGDPA
jgi:hypothetical protein